MSHIRAVWDGPKVKLFGLGGDALEAAKTASSYWQPGAQFAEAFTEGHWNGVRSLLRWNGRGTSHTLPAGLLPDVVRAVEAIGDTITVEDHRAAPPPRRDFGWKRGAELRLYQEQAVEAFLDGGGAEDRVGRGILKMAVRSGKTRTAAAILHRLGLPALFVVTSQILLRQAERVLRELLPRARITCFGDSDKDITGDVVIATAHSIVKAQKDGASEWKALRKRPVLVTDEAHHFDSEKWFKFAVEHEARFRLGLSATVWLGMKEKPTPEDIMLVAATGPVLHEVSMSTLVDAGFILRGDVRLHRVYEPYLWKEPWSQALWKAGIFENEVRNKAVVHETREVALGEKLRTIVTTSRVPHAEMLAERLIDAGVRATYLIGPHSDSRREAVLERFRAHKLDAIVSTVLSEGVDIPECEGVVVGEGGKSRRATLQRMRCLTPAEGKTKAVVVDVVDMFHKQLMHHSRTRIRTYRAERCFDFTVTK